MATVGSHLPLDVLVVSHDFHRDDQFSDLGKSTHAIDRLNSECEPAHPLIENLRNGPAGMILTGQSSSSWGRFLITSGSSLSV